MEQEKLDVELFDRFLSESCAKPSWVFVNGRLYAIRVVRKLFRYMQYLSHKSNMKIKRIRTR